ncbi:MAG: HNH endonuclease signature motif containing protein [Candidatus Baltobacteraceae bacterium]
MNPKKDRDLCTNCGVTKRKTNAKKFCSLQCCQDYRFKLRLHVFLAGKYPPLTQYIRFVRRVLIFLHGEHCSRCGWKERHPVTGKVPIEVEHIDGNWENNDPTNLTLLCPNCRSLTPTFRALNRGKGRQKRLGGRANQFAPSASPLRQKTIELQKQLLAEANAEITEVQPLPDVQLSMLPPK